MEVHISKFINQHFVNDEGQRLYKTSGIDKMGWQISGWGKGNLSTTEQKIQMLNTKRTENFHTLYNIQLELTNPQIYVIDIDGINGFKFQDENGNKRHSTDDELKQCLTEVYEEMPFLKMCPYTLSSGRRLPHFYLYIDNMIEYTKEDDISLNKKFNIDILKTKVNEAVNSYVYLHNDNLEIKSSKNNIVIPSFNWDTLIKKHFDVDLMTGNKNKQLLPKAKSTKGNKELKDKVKYIEKTINNILQINPNEYDDYSNWRNLGFMIKHELGESGYELFDSLSKKCKGYDEAGNYERWQTFKEEHDNPLTIASFYKRYKDLAIKQGEDYETVKIEFEKKAFRNLEEKNYYIIRENKTLVSYTKSEILDAYSHIKYYELDKKSEERKEYTFIERWIKDKDIRIFNNICMYPPPLNCPSTIYNSWKGFATDNVEYSDKYKDEVAFLRRHISILCNNNIELTKYIERWYLDLFQNPHRKSNVALIFVSTQGVGKELGFNNLLAKSIGEFYYEKPQNPEKHIFSQFNSICKEKLLICVDELNKKIGHDEIDNIKQKITDRNIYITRKGREAEKYPDYSRYIFLSNNENPIKMTADDRRFVVCDSTSMSREKLLELDKDYINKQMEYEKDINILKALLITLQNEYGYIPENYDWVSNRPKTEFYNDMVDDNRSPDEFFLQDYLSNIANIYLDNKDEQKEKIHKVKLSDIYQDFVSYLTSNNYQYKPTNILFGMKLKKHNLPVESKRMSYGKQLYFDIPKCIEVLKMKWNIDIIKIRELEKQDENHHKLI